MNKKELVEKVNKMTDIPVVQCKQVVDALEQVIAEELTRKSKGKRVLINSLYYLFSILKNKTTFFVLLCSFTLSVCAQQPLTQSIRGRVIDRITGQGLPAATVKVGTKEYHNTLTDDMGYFVLEAVPIGRHDITSSTIGYQSTLVHAIMLSSAKAVFLEIALEPKENQLDEIVLPLLSSREQSLNKMALLGSRLLTTEDASRFAGAMDDPARLVSSFAGVSSALGNNGISIHGNAPSLLQWRVEGVEVPNPNHFSDIATLGGGVLSSFSTHVLGNSNFYLGAFPAMYNNAVSGVFDMKLRPGNTMKYEHSVQLGALGIDFASEGPISRSRGSSYIFNYRYSTTGLKNKLSKSSSNDQLLDYQDLNFKFLFPTRKAGTFSIWGTSLRDKFKTEREDPSKWIYSDDSKYSEMNQLFATEGISHHINLRNGAVLNTVLASTQSHSKASEEYYDNSLNKTPNLELANRYFNIILSSAYEKTFKDHYVSTTGFCITNMHYSTNLAVSPTIGLPLNTISDGKGGNNLIAGYSSLLFKPLEKVQATVGLNAQVLTLNNNWTIEPRASLAWQMSNQNSIALGYGLHSRMEKMDVYFVKDTIGNYRNKNLGFTKSHHLTLAYTHMFAIGEKLKIEPYYQYLFHVPVEANGSYSVLNRTLFYVDRSLYNIGNGRNIGVDISYEKMLNNGFYYILTGAIFEAKYKGGDGIWHNSKFNRTFIINGLIGKEWNMGNRQRDVLSINLKATYQGGERYTPMQDNVTIIDPYQEIQYEESKAYSLQFAPMFLTNYTISYNMNRGRFLHEFALKKLNATGAKEYYGHQYNLLKGKIEPKLQSTSLFNVLYRFSF